MVSPQELAELAELADAIEKAMIEENILEELKEKLSQGHTTDLGRTIGSEEVVGILQWVVEKLGLPIAERFTDKDLVNIYKFVKREYQCANECDIERCDGIKFKLHYSKAGYVLTRTVCEKWMKYRFYMLALNQTLKESEIAKVVRQLGVNSLEEVSTYELAKIYSYSTGEE